MAVSLDALDIIKKYPEIYNTSNEKHVLGKDFEKILSTPEYEILGFLNGYIYCSYGNYIAKNTLQGIEISKVYLQCDHAAFMEGKTYFYTWHENVVTKITEDLSIEWELQFEDDIQSISMDAYGSFYVIFETSRTIRKFSSNKEDIMFITDSDDVTKKCKLYKLFITPGARFVYVIGSQFYGYNNAVDSFIDTYDMQTCKRTNRQIFAHAINVNAYDELYEYDNIILKGDYFYIYAKQYIMKINIRGVEMWRYTVAFNPITNQFDQIGHIEYDDNSYEEYIYFCEDLYSTNGHSFGKLYPNGSLEWKITLEENAQNAKFKMCVYQNKIYTSNRANIEQFKSFVLALDDSKILFKTRNGRLLKIVEYNKELYSAENYEGYNLYGRELKDGLDKDVIVPLRHDKGHIVTEDGKAILFTKEDPNYHNEENYEVFNLLHTTYSNTPNQLSTLVTTTHVGLRTLLGSVLKTKYPYIGDIVSQGLTTQDNEQVITGGESDRIVRNTNAYVEYLNLLGDRNIFKEFIISKFEGLRLTTKLKNYEIIRRVRTVYRYILSCYNDIDIVVEWLIQNDVAGTILPEYVDKLRHHTVSAIQTVQTAGVPTLYDIQPTKKFNYTYNTYKYTNQVYGTQIFMCNNIPFNKRNANPDKIYMDSIANLVDAKIMRPILLFLNGCAIKWTDITVVKDWTYTYLVIRNTNVNDNDLQCIYFPCNIRYGEDNNILDSRLNVEHLYFSEDGSLTENVDEVAFRIETVDVNVNGNTQYDCNKIEVPAEYDQTSSEKNILVFEDGKLFVDSRFYLKYYEKNLFKYDLSERDTSETIFKTFFYIKSNNYLGNLVKVPNQTAIKDSIEDRVTNNTNTPIDADSFDSPFNFKLYRTKSFERNIAEAVSYIMSYDMALLLDYYRNQSNIKSYTYSGGDIIKRAANTRKAGYLILPRSRKNNLSDYVVMFVNDDLYEYNYQIEYVASEFMIPIFNHVKETDTVEILHFRNVNNEVQTLTVNPREDDYIDTNLRYNNFNLFAHSAPETEFHSSPSYINDPDLEQGAIMYDLDYDYKNNFDEKGNYLSTSIKLENSYYYGKKISIASKRQFRYMYYNIYKDCTEFNLSSEFRFCHSKNHYMLFINKKRISFNEFDLVIAKSETTRKWNYITTTRTLHHGDIIEIFYLPDAYEEVTASNEDSKGYGDICIDTEELEYQFNKDLFLIFVDGKKLNYSSIVNVSDNRVRVKNRTGVIDNVIVLKMLQPDILLSEIASYSDTWSKSIDSLSPKDFERLFLTVNKK